MKVTLDYTSKVAKDSFYFHFSNHVWGQDDLFHCLQINESENPGLKYRFVPDSNRETNSPDITASTHIKAAICITKNKKMHFYETLSFPKKNIGMDIHK